MLCFVWLEYIKKDTSGRKMKDLFSLYWTIQPINHEAALICGYHNNPGIHAFISRPLLDTRIECVPLLLFCMVTNWDVRKCSSVSWSMQTTLFESWSREQQCNYSWDEVDVAHPLTTASSFQDVLLFPSVNFYFYSCLPGGLCSFRQHSTTLFPSFSTALKPRHQTIGEFNLITQKA